LNWWATTVTIRVRSLKRRVHHLNACDPGRLTGRLSFIIFEYSVDYGNILSGDSSYRAGKYPYANW